MFIQIFSLFSSFIYHILFTSCEFKCTFTCFSCVMTYYSLDHLMKCFVQRWFIKLNSLTKVTLLVKSDGIRRQIVGLVFYLESFGMFGVRAAILSCMKLCSFGRVLRNDWRDKNLAKGFKSLAEMGSHHQRRSRKDKAQSWLML